MSKFTDHLWSDLVREHGPALARADRRQPGRAEGSRVLRRPRVLAGSTLGLAGIGAALVLALGGSAAPPAFAITRNGDGSVLVKLNYIRGLAGANRQLVAMGIHEQIFTWSATGPAVVPGPIKCVPWHGVKLPPGPPVKVLVGTNGTEVIASGESAGNTAEGTFHTTKCWLTSDTGPGATGNSGNSGAG
jgi:hypothetical protein